MKLNTKRTFFIGLAFLSICAFWQLYDYVVPYILQYTFHLPEGISGMVMAELVGADMFIDCMDWDGVALVAAQAAPQGSCAATSRRSCTPNPSRTSPA